MSVDETILVPFDKIRSTRHGTSLVAHPFDLGNPQSPVREENLIFIISQPRSGSTALQKLLSNNASVATCSEPWILLRLCPILAPEHLCADFDFRTTTLASDRFLEQINHSFKQHIREEILRAYEKASKGFTFFLDKTPRYYEIASEIHALFPKARYIILKRHPAAVLHSMIQTWAKGRLVFSELKAFERDFLFAPRKILDFEQAHLSSRNVTTVFYENLVDDPEPNVRQLYDWLGISFDPSVLELERNQKTKGPYGDDAYNIHRSGKYLQHIVNLSKNRWHLARDRPELQRFIDGYLSFLGREFLEAYGYPDENDSLLSAIAHRNFHRYLFFSRNYHTIKTPALKILRSKFRQFWWKRDC